jgi:hypothetical protein
MADGNNISDGEYEELRRRGPRIGYWLGMLPTHPDIEALRMDPHFAPAPPGPPAPYPPPYPINNVPQNAVLPYGYGNQAAFAPPNAAIPYNYPNQVAAAPPNPGHVAQAQRAVERTSKCL